MLIAIEIDQHDPRRSAGGVVVSGNSLPQIRFALSAIHVARGGADVRYQLADDGLVDQTLDRS